MIKVRVAAHCVCKTPLRVAGDNVDALPWHAADRVWHNGMIAVVIDRVTLIHLATVYELEATVSQRNQFVNCPVGFDSNVCGKGRSGSLQLPQRCKAEVVSALGGRGGVGGRRGGTRTRTTAGEGARRKVGGGVEVVPSGEPLCRF